MILLDYNNRILQETIQQKIERAQDTTEKLEPTDVVFADFDGVKFSILSDANKSSLLSISLSWRAYLDCVKYGATDLLKKSYGSLLQSSPQSGFDVTLQVDVANPGSDKDLPNKLSLLKRHILAAPFYSLFDAVEKDSKFDMISLEYRDDEALYLKKIDKESCIVIFSISFKDADDVVFAKVFLQEFADARKQMRGVPAVTFSQKEAPGELKGVKSAERLSQTNGFVSFVLFKNHIDAKNRDRTIDNLQTFRNYLHYHIKCSKGFLHQRMRNRVSSLLLVLNRAKMELGEKEKKTIQGKTFQRK